MHGSITFKIQLRLLQPFLSSRLGIHDTCGIHNLHGMPGIFSGIGGMICAGVATTELYGHTSVLSTVRKCRLSI